MREKAEDRFGMFLLPFTVGLLFLIQPLNITHIEGLNDDFSNMLLQVTSGNASYNAPYTVIEMEQGGWVVVNADLPEGDYTLGVMADAGDGFSSTYDPKILEISYNEVFRPDFSNLRIQFVSSSGQITQMPYSVVGLQESGWVIVALEREPAIDETIDILAIEAAYPAGEDAPPQEEPAPPEETPEPPQEDIGDGEASPPEENLTTELPPQDGVLPPEEDMAGDEIPPEVEIPFDPSTADPLDLNVFDKDGEKIGHALKKAEKELDGKKSYDAFILLNESPINTITLEGVDEASLGLYVAVDDVPEDIEAPEGKIWAEVYAIDPSAISFTGGTFTAVAKANGLFKCSDWNFNSQKCKGEWVLIRDDLVSGAEYTVAISPADPAFGEANITIINVQSYPEQGGNWTVEFTTSGTANLTIRAVDGTTWNLTGDDFDLNFLELRCGDTILSPAWDEATGSVFYPDYGCNESGYETSKVIT
ncbi:MAG: hypothetical protein V1827_02405, partial [Candidatus Micrarchaeota archaeon]